MQATRENIIWIIADQLRASVLGVNGDPNASTPHLDLLAKQGVNFTNAVSGVPLCSPFRGCLLTSRYVHESSVPSHDYSLDPALPTIVDVFHEHGYHTGYFGKWHLDGDTPRKGTGQGDYNQIVDKKRRGRFQTWIGYENNNSQFDCYVHGHDGETEIPLTKLPGYETDALTDRVIDTINKWSEDPAGQPFFLTLSVQPPHDPYLAPAEYARHFKPSEIKLRPNVPPYEKVRSQASADLAGCYAMVENLDDNVGRIQEALVACGLAGRTHILFFSDHGDMHGSHGMFRKTNPFEEAIRIPFMIGGEALMGRGGRGCGSSPALVNHVDIAPTTLGLCGIQPPDWMKGFNYAPQRLYGLNACKNRPRSAYLQSVIATRHDHSTDRPYRGVVTEDGFKYVCFENNEWLMFDLNQDPWELTNLAHTPYAVEKRAELNRILAGWVKETGDDFKVPALEYKNFPADYETYPAD